MSKLSRMAFGAAFALLSGCQPSEPPPDIVKTQRDALNKAKEVEGQVQMRSQEQKRAADDASQ